MIENRELNIDDYLAMLRRRLKVILIPALLAPLVGFLISFAFPPKYTSQSLVLVEEQKVPEGYVKPVVTEDIIQRIVTMQQQVLSRNRLQPMIDRLGLAKGKSVDEVVDGIRLNLDIQPVQTTGTTPAKRRPGQNDVPGFYVNFTADNPWKRTSRRASRWRRAPPTSFRGSSKMPSATWMTRTAKWRRSSANIWASCPATRTTTSRS